MNKLLLIGALAVAAYFALLPGPGTSNSSAPSAGSGGTTTVEARSDDAIEHAFANRLHNQQLAGQGTVVKILPDDHAGSRHQRFIVRLDSGRTLLIAHNIDLASRIDALSTGDTVSFYGEYEWNPKGGVMHWTHHDPQGRHPGGWIRHNGNTYQ